MESEMENAAASSPLLPNDSAVDADREDVEETPKYKYRYYTLPGFRFTNIVRTVVFVDTMFSLVLWILGGNNKYFVDNILHFHLTQSTFDLALISTVKVILLFILYSSLEDTTLKQLQEPYEPTLIRRKRHLHVAIIFFSFVFFAYPVVKGGFILNALINDPNYQHMHLTYNILAISIVVFGFLELILSLVSFGAMRRLKVSRIMHRLDENYREVDEDGKIIQKKANLFRLIMLAKPEFPLLGLACLCLLGSTASTTAAPLFFGLVVDAALRSMAELNKTVLILLLIYVGGAIMGMLRSWLFTLSGQRLVARLRSDLFARIVQQEVAFFDTNRTGELTNRLASDTQVLQNAITANVSMLTRNILQILGSLVFMFVLNASLTGVLLAVVPVVSLGAVQYGKYVQRVRKNFQDRLAEASATAEEAISGIRTVRSFAGENKASKAYAAGVDKSYKEGKKLALAQGTFEGTIGALSSGAICLVLWYGGKLVNEQAISSGILTSFLLYTLNVAFAFGTLSSLYGDFMQAVGASMRIFELLDRKPEVTNEGGLELVNLNGEIKFNNVRFTYPSRKETEVLKGVTFSVKPGEMVALVGPSGGGKSTIVSMIERFYDPDSGEITLGGEPLQDLDPQWYRRQMSMVSQEPTLFACSIRDNIAYGRDATDEQVEDAARQANAHDFIQTFEDGYKTLVGERGVRLSGGQKQRVAIARALIMNPTVLLLDEATSALDAESEHLVQEAVDRAMVNRTVLVIAHRLSTVRNASKVIVIDKGSIAEEGTHEELIAKDGVYKKLVLRQLTAGEAMAKTDEDTEDDKTREDEKDPEEPRGHHNENFNRGNGGIMRMISW